MVNSFSQLIKEAQRLGSKRFSIAGSESPSVLQAVIQAKEMGIMEPILVGKKENIYQIANKHHLNINRIEIEDCEGDNNIALRAVELIVLNKADALMKGHIMTPTLLKCFLNKKFKLYQNRLLSHIALLEIPNYHKLLLITDSGMVIRPTFEQKKDILHNALTVIRKLGVQRPKVAILSATEKINPDIPETVDAVKLVTAAQSGEFGDVDMEGPMALDMAFSKEAAQIKGVQSLVAGQPDIVLVPDVSCGNIFAKGLVYFANAKISGFIVGAKVPIVLISRAERPISWLFSIATTNIIS